MVELIGIAGITGVLAGSLLLSLFIAQSLVNCVVIVMANASERAQTRREMERREMVSPHRPVGAHMMSGQRPRAIRA
jgi:hypothetical protein